MVSKDGKEDLKDPSVRAKYAYLEASVSIIGNTLLFLLKFYLGIFINSIGLITDSFHTLSDSASSVVVILGFKASSKTADEQHPFGHGRFEHIATLVIAVLLFVAGAQFILESIQRLLNMVGLERNEYTVYIGVVVLLSALVKEAMARYSIGLGRKIESPALLADAWHHRTDALTSVAVGIGIIGAHYGYYVLDPIFGVVVSVLIIYTGVSLFRYSSDALVGRSPDKKIVDSIEEAASEIDGVCGVHRITVHDYGPTKVVSLHVEVGCDITAEEAHNIAKNVEDKVADLTRSSTIVHVDPDKEPQIDTNEVESAVIGILKENKSVLFFHNVKISSGGNLSTIDMHIVVDSEMPVSMSHNLTHNIETMLKNRFPNCIVNTHIEPCIGECETCPEICKKK